MVLYLLQGLLYLACSFGLKTGLAALLHVQDDAHVFELLKAKFTDYKVRSSLHAPAGTMELLRIKFKDDKVKSFLR
jgi:hypothetical protein